MYELEEPFREALYIIEKIEKNGHQAFFVGGCVRDLLLRRPIGDVDITTSLTPDKVQGLFDEVIPVGIEHGTVIVRHNQMSYEVTTFRLESDYSDSRHPDSVEFIDKIDQDLARRDFTINALAMDKKGKILDLFKGQEDLENRIIRTVGKGYDRFQEDPLRILRAIRFSSQLGFTIEKDTLRAVELVKPKIEGLAIERVTVEIEKLFAGKGVQTGLMYLDELGIEKHLPIIKDYPVLHHLRRNLRPLNSLSEVICIFHQLNPKVKIRAIAKAWKLSNKVLQEALKLNESISYYKKCGMDKWLIYKLLPNSHHAFTRIMEVLLPQRVDTKLIQDLKKELPILSKKDLNINGNDIIGLLPNLKKGPWIQDLLDKLEKQVVLGKLENKRTILKEWIKCNPPEIK